MPDSQEVISEKYGLLSVTDQEVISEKYGLLRVTDKVFS